MSFQPKALERGRLLPLSLEQPAVRLCSCRIQWSTNRHQQSRKEVTTS